MSAIAVGSAVAGGIASAAVGSALGGGKSGGDASSAADPFASQRMAYQELLGQLMTGHDSKGNATPFSPSDPSYNWRFKQGQQAVETSQAAKGMLNSGNILTALTDYGQGEASTEYANEFSRLSQLAGANIGSPAAAGQIIAGQNASNTQAAGTVASQIGGAVSQGVNSFFQPSNNSGTVAADYGTASNPVGNNTYGFSTGTGGTSYTAGGYFA